MARAYGANCDCGFRSEVKAGSTRALAIQHKYYYPAFCRDCGKIGGFIFGIPEPDCGFCQSTNVISYYDSELKAGGGSAGEDVDLSKGFYFCPQCRDFSLSFIDRGFEYG